jgi:hypothetical protein
MNRPWFLPTMPAGNRRRNRGGHRVEPGLVAGGYVGSQCLGGSLSRCGSSLAGEDVLANLWFVARSVMGDVPGRSVADAVEYVCVSSVSDRRLVVGGAIRQS